MSFPVIDKRQVFVFKTEMTQVDKEERESNNKL